MRFLIRAFVGEGFPWNVGPLNFPLKVGEKTQRPSEMPKNNIFSKRFYKGYQIDGTPVSSAKMAYCYFQQAAKTPQVYHLKEFPKHHRHLKNPPVCHLIAYSGGVPPIL